MQEEAAEIAGYDPAASSFRSNARKWCQHHHVRIRVAEIQKAGAALAGVSAGSLILEAEEARQLAMSPRVAAPAAAVGAIDAGPLEKVLANWRAPLLRPEP